ncbi:acetyltransferase [Aspergillus terreus]|uniref:Acetyltransferase n=1 Tax=Aspergillus terreus TaxID=33178 RepID=A0A5M3ZA65_ASPTE|nr:hypothetical protein ATETN484_0012000300 [Aspergillus terreus]GFF19230.1 acetyltransferase [Aspergillus terreus]
MTPANSAAIGTDHEPAKDTRAEHSPSRFTAVNGKDSLTTEPSAVPAIPGSSLNSDGHVDPAGSRGKAAYEEHNRENGSLGNDQDATSQSSSLGGPAATNRGKRKRSECDEPENTPRPPNRDIKSPSRLEDMSEPPTQQQQQTPNGVGMTTLEQNSKPPSTSAAPLRLSENEETRPSPTNVPWNEYDSQLVNQAQRAQQIDASDAQLAEVLQREAGGHDTPPKNWGTPARSEGSLTNDQPGAVAAAPQERPQPVAPKRKRVFSNRTKTGYHLEAGKMRPIVVEDADRAAAQFNSSPTGVGSNRGSWSKRTWPNTGHPPFATDHVTKQDYREVPSIHELPRDSHPKADYQIVPPIRELSHSAHSKPAMPLFQSGIDQRPALTNTSAMDTNTPQAQARMALSIEHQLSARAVSGEESEKEKMMRGELYRPFDIHLVEERDRCKAALWRFNNACNPISGLSAKEQNRLLKEIFVPPNAAVNSPSGSPRPSGSIGQGAVVESPFQCHYGYNVHIGEDVMISESCLFVDDCTITIGAHTWIGPRVTILSSMAHANMQERKGSQSRHQGRPVTIEEDCYVGAGCTIYPGVRLRRGAYVAPGEVVKSDIVAYGFQGLKPSYM